MIKKFKRKILLTTSIILIIPFNLLVGSFSLGILGVLNYENQQILREISTYGFSGPLLERIDDQYAELAPFYSVKVYPNDDVEVLSTADVIDKEHVVEVIEHIIRSPKKTGIIDSFQYITIDKSGHLEIIMRDMSLTTSSYIQRDLNKGLFVLSVVGSIVLFGLANLITKLLTKPVEQAFTRQKQFINDASHELKTPLSIMSLNLDLIKDENKDKKEFNYITNEVKRMDTLVKNLLDTSKMDEFNFKINKQTANISNALYEIALPFESIAFEKSIDFNLNIEDSIESKVDIELIKQVFVILLDNAIKYTQPNNKIDVVLKREKRKIIFSVFNQGDYIKEEDQKHIFERFYRVEKSRTSSGSYGLGLSIAKNIIEKHSGKITLVSTQGKGNTFTVKL